MNFLKFEDMPIWQQSMEVAKDIYSMTSNGPFSKDFALRDQIRRSIISVSSNIAEGYERDNNKEFYRFLSFAKASAAEARSQIHLATLVGYIDSTESQPILTKLKSIAASLRGFMKYLKQPQRSNL